MAPELFQEGGAYSSASDLWALGCVLYQLAVGHPPFVAGEFSQLVSDILSTQPRAIPGEGRAAPCMSCDWDQRTVLTLFELLQCRGQKPWQCQSASSMQMRPICRADCLLSDGRNSASVGVLTSPHAVAVTAPSRSCGAHVPLRVRRQCRRIAGVCGPRGGPVGEEPGAAHRLGDAADAPVRITSPCAMLHHRPWRALVSCCIWPAL